MIMKICCLLLCLTAICESDKFYDDCGLEDIIWQPLVRGGMRVAPREFPWHVAILYNDGPGDNFKQICGGSLVRSQLVITAAHCFSMKEDNHTVDLPAYRIVGGSLNSTWTTEDLDGRQQSEVRAVHLGVNYGAHTRDFQDDIAIVHLQTEFIFSPVVRAVCLDLMDRELHNSQTSPGTVGKVAGWGITETGTLSKLLNFLRVPVVGKTQCYQQMPSSFKNQVTSDKICAGLTNGSAMCPGDSGGGLVFPVQDTITGLPRWYLRAVLSNAPRSQDPLNDVCQTTYVTLYTNIFPHRTWLSKNMEQIQPQERCRMRGSAGSCEKFTNCPAAMEDATRGILPVNCSPSSSKICCLETIGDSVDANCQPLPPSIVSQQKTGSKAQDYCVDLAERLHPCQQNGSSWSREDLCGPDPDNHDSRYQMARLTKSSESEIQRYAFVADWEGGIPVYLINERWLLTRASQWDDLSGKQARDINPPPEVIFSVSRTVPHPQYLPGNRTNDILLVEMDMPVPFTSRYRPVCLHTAQDTVGALTLFRRDWVNHGYNATLMTQKECRRAFPTRRRGAAGGVTDNHLCATSGSGWCAMSFQLTASNGHRVACTELLVGLFLDFKQTSSTCTGLYLRVSSFTPWVESVVWP